MHPRNAHLLAMTREWGKELCRFPEAFNHIVAEEAAKSLLQVQRGRNTDAALKELITRIEDRIALAARPVN